MKRLYVILAILGVILLTALAGVFYAKDTCSTLLSMTEEAQKLCEREDAELLYQQAEKMSAFLESRHLILSLYVRHDELEKLTLHLSDLCAKTKSGDIQVAVTLSQITFMSRHIYERELPNLDNLL